MSGSSSVTQSDHRTPLGPTRWRLPVGAEYLGGDTTHVRVWAPAAREIAVVVDGAQDVALASDGGGYFSGAIAAAPGSRYQFRIDNDSGALYPDPASRFQPDGPHGASEIVDPASFHWTDERWPGLDLADQVIYEMHVGTFSREGTWAGAAREIEELARIGVTIIEVMPVADFHGRFGWGYDGVNLFAPTRLYGRPDDFRRFVDTAHAHGVGVILDVVYNHFGPVGNYLRKFAPAYFTDRHTTEWGEAINFDGPDAGPVREYFAANAGYWIDEFHLDGLRLDATQQMYDSSTDHVIAQIGRRAREAAGYRRIVLVAENEPQDTRLVRPLSEGGCGLDGLWNDDLHHSAIVALTGRAEAYYSDTRGDPQELISAAKYGYLFQGQLYNWQRKPRGTPAWGLPPETFVTFLENHDQVANSAQGLRVHQITSPGRWRAMTAFMLLAPGTPMLFQGQEFSASAPFLYFADLDADLADLVREGRREFLTQFPSIAAYVTTRTLDDPIDPATPARCVLDFAERRTHAAAYALHKDLLALRRGSAAFQSASRLGVDGAVLSADAFVLRFFTDDHLDDRLLVVNLGGELRRASIAEPLLAPPASSFVWAPQWSTEDAAYGGGGLPAMCFAGEEVEEVDEVGAMPASVAAIAERSGADPCSRGGYLFPAESAVLLRPAPRAGERGAPSDPPTRA